MDKRNKHTTILLFILNLASPLAYAGGNSPPTDPDDPNDCVWVGYEFLRNAAGGGQLPNPQVDVHIHNNCVKAVEVDIFGQHVDLTWILVDTFHLAGQERINPQVADDSYVAMGSKSYWAD